MLHGDFACSIALGCARAARQKPRAVAEAIVARLPADDNADWRIGHFVRRPPAGYMATLQMGVNQIEDPDLARYYDRLDIDLPPGLVLLIGENAQGKSNLLEALYLLSTARSTRASVEAELINWSAGEDGSAVARLVASAETIAGPLKLELAVVARPGPQGPIAGKTVRVNGVPRRLSDAVGRFLAVLFTAEDIELVSGPPASRRQFLDITLSQVEPGYAAARHRFERVLLQRNHLLKRMREGGTRAEELAFWDEQLCKDGIEASAIHGNKSQGARTRALASFKSGELRVLVATDLAARGLDIEELPHVVNYDLPHVPEDYVHRIGRTGRAGASGEAVSLVCGEDRPLLAAIERLINRRIEQRTIAGFEPGSSYHAAAPRHEPGRLGHPLRCGRGRPCSARPLTRGRDRIGCGIDRGHVLRFGKYQNAIESTSGKYRVLKKSTRGKMGRLVSTLAGLL